MSTEKKTILSGIKPTGRVHLGNYFGAMRQNIAHQETYETFLPIVDYHALTTLHDAGQMRAWIHDLVIDYLAIGLDPEKTALFQQSELPEHTELAWIFNCITGFGYLSRGHAFKDAQAKNKDISVGVFDYPMLMASDILLYDADVVPVGADQKQHIEFARDTALKFNGLFGQTFKLPEPLIMEDLGEIPGTDGRKMSKSYQNTISLFASDDDIQKGVMSIPTNSTPRGEPIDAEKDNLFAFHKLFSEDDLDKIEEGYGDGSLGYKESKEWLIANMCAFIEPLRKRREAFAGDDKQVKSILREGVLRARERTSAKMELVRERIGVR